MNAKSSYWQVLSFEAGTQTRPSYNHTSTSKGHTSKSEVAILQNSLHLELRDLGWLMLRSHQ
jgi:hypothetical protein